MDAYEQALGGISAGRILDVATGEGEFIATLVHNLRSYTQIVGIDVYEYTKSVENPFTASEIHFVQMDVTRLAFTNETFDAVSISSSLHHLADIPLSLAEMMRVLKPGGYMIIRETHRNTQTQPQLTDMYLHHWVAEIDSALGDTHNLTFSRQALLALAEGLDLAEVALYDILNTDTDPMKEDAIKDSEDVIDQYLEAAKQVANYNGFQRRGEELRRRLHKIGIQWEPELLIVGMKR
jgi:SAM-dependent methyltransferase